MTATLPIRSALGGRVSEAPGNHANVTGLPCSPGTIVNHGFWGSDDGVHPRGHPWLTVVGTKDGELIYAYAPAPISRPVTPLPMIHLRSCEDARRG